VSLDLCPVDRPVDRIVPYSTITLPAEVGITNADQVRAELLRAIDDGPELLIVDMTGTSYCAVAGVHVLVWARRRAADAGIGLRVAVGAPIVRRVLQLTGADQLIDVYPGLDAALTGLPVMDASLPR
jgi:anti-sigma B factor antagonist